MGSTERDRDLERLIPIGGIGIPGDVNEIGSKSSPPSESPLASTSLSHHSGKEAFSKVIRSWASKKFMSGCVILFPIAITFYISWWFIHFVDGFFSPIYAHLGIKVFGLGFVTSITFIFLIGVFMSSWLGASVLGLGEWFIKKMPLMSYIYAASKQISVAISPDQNSQAFIEVAIIRHPRIEEYALGFITSTVILRKSSGSEELCCVFTPTNPVYLGDIFLINPKDVMRPNLTVREGIVKHLRLNDFMQISYSSFIYNRSNNLSSYMHFAEIVISGGMSIPKILTIVDAQSILSAGVGKSAVAQV